MDEFGYLSVLLSVILGLALTQLLTGFRGIVLARSRVARYAPPMTWAASLVLVVVQTWWAMFGLRTMRGWTFLQFAIVLAQTIALYMAAAVVLPDFGGEGAIDLRAHYDAHRRAFFGILIAAGLISLTKDLVISGSLPAATNVGFHAIFIGTTAIAMGTTRERYHRLLAPLILLLFCLYVALLFTRMPG